MQINYLMMILSLSMILMPFSKSILTAGAALLLVSFLTTVILSKMVNPWFGLILFLIYITGLLVMFGYLLAMTPNPKTSIKTSKIFFLISLMAMFIMLMETPKNNLLPPSIMSVEWMISPMFNHFNIPIYWMMAIILLVVLIMVVSLCYKTQSPLRPFFTKSIKK